jgi:hypothetical protein
MSTLVTLDLSSGIEIAVQTNDVKSMPNMAAALSFDSKQGNHTFWMRRKELEQLGEKIAEALEPEEYDTVLEKYREGNGRTI